jgi:DNA-binding transcriptional regulator YhcF (GntR family)
MALMSVLDPDDSRPPYVQVVDALRQEIERGDLEPGVKLPTHQQLVAQYGVSLGTVKRALGELQGAGLVVSRQGQGAFVRVRRSVLETIPNAFSAEVLRGYWVTAYEFSGTRRSGFHADITEILAVSTRKIVAQNHPPEPRTDNSTPAFRNEIDAQLANRHFLGYWKNLSDTRYFGALHLAILPEENVMTGHYTSYSTDISVGSMPWLWVRLDPSSLAGVDITRVKLKEPAVIYAILNTRTSTTPIHLAEVTENGDRL